MAAKKSKVRIMPADQRDKDSSTEVRALGRMVVYLRMIEGKSQQDLAKAIGIPSSQLSKWEWGGADLLVRSREKLAGAFGLARFDFEELALRVDRSVRRLLSRLRGEVKEPTRYTDRSAVLARIEEVRRARRDLAAERVEIEEALRGTDREEDLLLTQLEKLKVD